MKFVFTQTYVKTVERVIPSATAAQIVAAVDWECAKPMVRVLLVGDVTWADYDIIKDEIWAMTKAGDDVTGKRLTTLNMLLSACWDELTTKGGTVIDSPQGDPVCCD